ncbi:MAG: hypothetical protein IKM07_06680 [Clostridia bacterium]|nr:hypothetical protein [Clostridia bacterium]
MLKPEKICDTMPFENGADPTWSRGNSVILRVGDRVFVTNNRVFPRRAPNNRTSLEVYEKRDGGEWKLVFYEEGVYQREPCPILYLGDNKIAVTVNPTVETYPEDMKVHMAPCTPLVYIFDISGEVRLIDTVKLTWDDPDYRFADHSYRSFAIDDINGNLFFTNQYLLKDGGGAHCWTLTDHEFKPLRAGKLKYPVRACYQNIAMRGGETYVFALRDIVEPVQEWKDYKYQVTQQHWDYDFRMVYLNYTPDIASQDFGESVVVCDRDATCGWVTNLDCCWDKNGDLLLLISAQNVHHAFMRDKFFPGEKLETVLEVYRLKGGKVVDVQCIDKSREEEGSMTDYAGFFHTASDGRVYIVWSKSTGLSDNPVPTGTYLTPVDALSAVPVKLLDTFGRIFGSKTRLGAGRSDVIDLYWPDGNKAIMYACCDLRKL